jgi:ABC-type phosphate/phosphonate transport system substrate-binding protein
MTPLSLTFYLGSALVPVADRLAASIGERLGTVVEFDPDATDSERRAAIDDPKPGFVWLCGLDTVLRQQDGRLGASIIGAPVFPGRERPVYDSVIVASDRWSGPGVADFEGGVLAINQPESWSGHHAVRALLQTRGLRRPMFRRFVVTGSHEASIDALLAGDADCAAIDDTVWQARVARDPRAAALRIVDRTDAWPAPPFSLVDGLAPDLAADARKAILDVTVPGLEAIAPASDADYAVFHDGLAASRALPWSSP